MPAFKPSGALNPSPERGVYPYARAVAVLSEVLTNPHRSGDTPSGVIALSEPSDPLAPVTPLGILICRTAAGRFQFAGNRTLTTGSPLVLRTTGNEYCSRLTHHTV